MSIIDSETSQVAETVLSAYGIEPASLTQHSGGLINLTLKVVTRNADMWILQRLHPVFPPAINSNIDVVTRYLAEHGACTPRLQHTLNDALWVEVDGQSWRVLTFVPGRSFATLPDLIHATAAGKLLGAFHATMAGFTADLPCPRPAVHDPERHQTALIAALATHTTHRLHDEVRKLASVIANQLAALPALPATAPRLIHGDPKLSNLLFDADARPLCLVDLDTLIRAPLPFELGDAFRSWCNLSAEDALTATFELSLFAAAIAGYAATAGEFITATEASAIVLATEIICLELAMRFAADALNESYFGWDITRFGSSGEHNLRRARNQLLAARAVRAQCHDAARIVTRAFA